MALKNEESTIGHFFDFVEEGELIDGVTVGVAAHPDLDPATNWDEIGTVVETTLEAKTETDPVYTPTLAGPYEEDERERVVADYFKFTTLEMNELYWRNKLGFADKIQDGTAQPAFAKSQRRITGWGRSRAVAEDGTVKVDQYIYGHLSIDDNPTWAKDRTKPAWKFQKVYSAIATATPQGITS